MPRIAVVGGGIAGLAAAFRTVELCPEVELTLFEASPRLGGVLSTERTSDGYQIEHGSDSFITNRPGAVELCQRLGMADRLLQTNDRFRRTFVVHRGQLRDVPEGFLLMAPTKIWSVLTSPVLSLAGKARLAWEYFIPPRPAAAGDESLASFVRRRLGREAFERLVQPLVGGIYTADAEQLSLAATLPRFLDMERQHGGLIRAARKEAASQKARSGQNGARQSGARYSLFVTPQDGLSSLVAAIVARLPAGAVRLSTPVSQVVPSAVGSTGGWQVSTDAAGSFEFDGVIVATPAPVATRQLQPLDAELAAGLAAIPYAGAAVVSLGYDRSQIGHALDGFGFVVPEVEGLRILACSFSSVKFAGRAPEGKALLRVFIGGAKRPDLVGLDDAALTQIVTSELAPLLSIRGAPELVRVGRYLGAMPQYHVGHLERVAQIERQAARHAGLELCGNAYRGVGIPDTITSGEAAAERLLASLVSSSLAPRKEGSSRGA